jgi:hypothetical protein
MRYLYTELLLNDLRTECSKVLFRDHHLADYFNNQDPRNLAFLATLYIPVSILGSHDPPRTYKTSRLDNE